MRPESLKTVLFGSLACSPGDIYLARRASVTLTQEILSGVGCLAAAWDLVRGDGTYLLHATILIKVLGQTPERIIGRGPAFCAAADEQR